MNANDSRSIEEVVYGIGERFKSGNSIPVERVSVTRAEWQAVCNELDELTRQLDAYEDSGFRSREND